MSEEIKEILDKLNKTADDPLFVICSSQKELDKIPKYTANFLSVNDRQAKLLLNYITNLQQKVEQLEKENKELNRMCELYGQSLYNADLIKAEKRVEQLENIRKEAIKKIHKNSFEKEEFGCWFRVFKTDLQGIAQDLLNILKKGGNK